MQLLLPPQPGQPAQPGQQPQPGPQPQPQPNAPPWGSDCHYIDVPVQMAPPSAMAVMAPPVMLEPARFVDGAASAPYAAPPHEVIREVPYEVVREVTKEVPIEIVREVHDAPYYGGGYSRGGGYDRYGGGRSSSDEYDRIIEERKERRAREGANPRGRSALDQRRADHGESSYKTSYGSKVYDGKGSKGGKGSSGDGKGMLRGKPWDDKSPTNSKGMLTGGRVYEH